MVILFNASTRPTFDPNAETYYSNDFALLMNTTNLLAHYRNTATASRSVKPTRLTTSSVAPCSSVQSLYSMMVTVEPFGASKYTCDVETEAQIFEPKVAPTGTPPITIEGTESPTSAPTELPTNSLSVEGRCVIIAFRRVSGRTRRMLSRSATPCMLLTVASPRSTALVVLDLTVERLLPELDQCDASFLGD